MERPLSPEQKVQFEAHKKAMQQLKRDMNIAFGTPEGRRVLLYLHTFCGYDKVASTENPQTKEVQANNAIHNSAVRSVYCTLRKHLDPEILIDVEIYGVKQHDLLG